MPNNFLSTLLPAEPSLPCDPPWGNLVFSMLIIHPYLSAYLLPHFRFLQYLSSCGIHFILSHLLPLLKVYAPFPGSSLLQVKSLRPWTNPLDSICLFPGGTIIISMLKRIPFCSGPQRFLIKH